jgi:hypothetical protein
MSQNYPPYPTKLVPEGGEAASGGEPYYPPKPDKITPEGGGPGGIRGFNRQRFIKNYANMVARTWVDESYLELLLASPAETLAAAGLEATEGAVFRIIQVKITGMGSVDQQVDAWVEGFRTGLYDLYLPIKPEDIDIELGGEMAEAGDTYCCCCTPCCCCT